MNEPINIQIKFPEYDFWKFSWLLGKVAFIILMTYSAGFSGLESILITLGVWLLSVAYYLAKIYRHNYKNHIIGLYHYQDTLEGILYLWGKEMSFEEQCRLVEKEDLKPEVVQEIIKNLEKKYNDRTYQPKKN